jgi:hypothetical protein
LGSKHFASPQRGQCKLLRWIFLRPWVQTTFKGRPCEIFLQ